MFVFFYVHLSTFFVPRKAVGEAYVQNSGYNAVRKSGTKLSSLCSLIIFFF